jgi:hypothetical protein
MCGLELACWVRVLLGCRWREVRQEVPVRRWRSGGVLRREPERVGPARGRHLLSIFTNTILHRTSTRLPTPRNALAGSMLGRVVIAGHFSSSELPPISATKLSVMAASKNHAVIGTHVHPRPTTTPNPTLPDTDAMSRPHHRILRPGDPTTGSCDQATRPPDPATRRPDHRILQPGDPTTGSCNQATRPPDPATRRPDHRILQPGDPTTGSGRPACLPADGRLVLEGLSL